MNELHLFAGVGGGILGSRLLGHTTVCAVERDAYRRKVLLQRQRDGCLNRFPIWDDVRTFPWQDWSGQVDIVSGGFPCQRFSSATRGNATAEDLWPEMRRVILGVEPTFVFAENVSRRAIEIAAEDLESMGYRCKAVELSASDLGADHIRKRSWLLGYAHGYRKPRCAKHDEAPRMQGLRAGVWESDPQCLRIPHGLAPGLDRTRAAGDGQVPVVAAAAWRILWDAI